MPHIFNPDLESGRIASRQSPGGPPCCNDRKGEQRKSAAAPQFRRVSDPAIRKQARSFAPGLFASILQTISPRTSPRGTPGSDGRCAKSKSSSDTRPGKLPYWYSYRSPVRPSWPPSPWRGGHPRHVPAAVTRATTHGRRRKASPSRSYRSQRRHRNRCRQRHPSQRRHRPSGWECCWHPARHSYGPR